MPTWRTWKFTSKKAVAACSGWRPKQALIWISKAEKAKSWEDLEDDEGMDSLSAKVATGIIKIATQEFANNVQYLQETNIVKGKGLLNGRQIWWMMAQYFKISTANGALFALRDLMTVQRKGDNINGFMLDWDTTLLYMKERPEDDVLETLFWEKIIDSPQLQRAIKLMKHNIAHAQNGWQKTYEVEHRMVQIHLEDRRKETIRRG